MKNILMKIVEFFKNFIVFEDKNEVPEPIIVPVEEPNGEEPIITPPVIETPVEEPKNEPYVMLNIKERQERLKKIGLYGNGIDGIVGNGTKKAVKIFNLTFLNRNDENYEEDTDKLLRVLYDKYCQSPYMTSDLWQYFKNFKESEYYCTCNKKYCDGWNGLKNKLPFRLVMIDQYIRSYFNVSVNLSSTIRCVKRNKEVGGVAKSPHLEFRANDLTARGHKSEEVRQLVYVNKNTSLPCCNYAYNINNSYVHVSIIV